ncbi:MAG TPA: CotH kinase family protein [Planctomycetota bacterium]
MKRWLRSAWRWSWLVTVPASVVFASWVLTTWQRWRRFSVDYDATPWRTSLHETGVDTFDSMLWRARIRLLGSDLNAVPADQQLRSIQLFAGEPELAKLDENLPYSGFEYVEALLMYPDGLRKVQMRYRGDYLWHWGHDKKSIRIRTRSDELFAGMRQFNLIAPKFPEHVNNVASYRLASMMGLITPQCELVNVFVNGHNRGVHEFTEQFDEGTLRRHGRMPGDVYSGDLVSRDEVRGTSNQVFEMPQSWIKSPESKLPAQDSRVPLQQLLRLLNSSPNEASQAELSQLLDMDVWGRFGAFELLVQTNHYDEGHNWRLYWDPWRLKFEPLIWDPIGWAPLSRPVDGVTIAMDVVTSRLHQWLLQNGDFLQARHEALQSFFEHSTMQGFLAELEVMSSKVAHALLCDPNRRPNTAWLQFWMPRFRPYVDQVLHAVRTAHLSPGTVRWARADAQTVRLLVDGRRPVSQVSLRFERPLTEPVPAVLRVRHFGVPHDVDLGAGVSVHDNTLRVPARLFCELVPTLRFMPCQAQRHHGRTPAPATWDLCLPQLPGDNRLLGVEVVRGGTPQLAEEVAELPPRDVEFVYRATPPLRSASPRVWRGDVAIDGVHEVKDDVTIEPGTVVRLGPGACILFRGRVTAAGTREQPIRFEPQHPEQPAWGTVALNGAACSGSVLQWCDMRGGSGYKVPLEEYCSMLSIHNCEQVSVVDCAFAANAHYDDMIHTTYASVVLDRVSLVGAAGDGLDCDASTVVIRNSSFLRCRGDAVDLTTARASIHDCRFEDAGEKGLSIAENTHLVALRCRFLRCNLAVEARDGSIAHVANSDIRRGRKAVSACRKDLRYDSGGWLSVWKSVLVDNAASPTADGWSRLDLIDCQVTGELAAEYDQPNPDGTSTRLVNAARLVDADATAKPRRVDPLPFPEDLRRFEHLFAETWGSLRAETRGVPDGH